MLLWTRSLTFMSLLTTRKRQNIDQKFYKSGVQNLIMIVKFFNTARVILERLDVSSVQVHERWLKTESVSSEPVARSHSNVSRSAKTVDGWVSRQSSVEYVRSDLQPDRETLHVAVARNVLEASRDSDGPG